MDIKLTAVRLGYPVSLFITFTDGKKIVVPYLDQKLAKEYLENLPDLKSFELKPYSTVKDRMKENIV